ncbi:glycosyltransferase family 4 protein [Sphingobacterium phlebotomi]|uniref:Glycosyltransferase family 4 protein n=1 Tax=Sphingobacterium phlebotomi TaxID=2605433 RepID=A0A5D4H559_9SPHI|nr:glycosyltransferase family 4 protein [Sphingobacterium phlebotomi]TYR35737.1 glycosyltransferase family 4 protein [Sphingobacterium phlebotomi]
MNKYRSHTVKRKSLRIAQIAPLYESLPPKLYGGTERIVHYLTEELVHQGHNVTLFASGDSITQGRLIACVNEGLRLKRNCIDPLAYHIIQMQELSTHVNEFDILHFHTDYLHFPLSNMLKIPSVTTLHGRLDIPELRDVYNVFPYQNLISISENQRLPLPQGNFIKTVYHGLPENLHHQGDGKGGYLAFLGRISPEKGVERAIKIALATNTKLKIAAKIDKADFAYYEKNVKFLLDDPLIEYIGEINEQQKTEFLGNAKALLFPIDWPEPFGLVMIEAMACGTPVIAFRNGSVPEIMENNITGFIVNSVMEAIDAVSRLEYLSRAEIRRVFERRFTVARMAENYIDMYHSLVNDTFKNVPRSSMPILNKPA